MVSIDDIRSLARLARLKLTGDEEESLQKDISGILEYVATVSMVETPSSSSARGGIGTMVPNVMREDAHAEVLGERGGLLAAFPKREGDFNSVRKIIEKDAAE